MSAYGNWKRLNYHKPEIGKKYEWVLFDSWWQDKGVGKWYDNDNNLVNEYKTLNNQIIYHFDFYRINNVDEAFDMGAEEYFYSGNLCLIEWPDKIMDLLPDRILKISIDYSHKKRNYCIEQF